MINAQPKNLWSTTRLFEEYANICDNSDETKKETRQVISDLKDYYGEDLVEMKIEGCASLFSLRNHLAEKLKPEEPSDNEDNLEEIVKQIKFETKNILKQNTYYNIDTLTKDGMINDTSETLLKLISKLVSKDIITRDSLSLSQSIQALITKNANQTNLGLGIKLHHRLGSRELISLLHQYGYLCTYDEVQRFRISVAKYTRERDYTSRGLRKNVKIIASWCDNYDLQVNTPNGQRETHSMAIEWRQQVPDNNDFDSIEGEPLVIPRLSKEEAKLVQINELAPVEMICYQGPVNHNHQK